MSQDEDEFYAIRSAFYCGDHKEVLKEAKSLKSKSGIQAKERDAYLCRSLISQGKYKEATKVIGDSVATPLLAVKKLLLYKQASDIEEKELIISELNEIIKDEEEVLNNNTFCVVSSQLYILNGNYNKALKLVYNNNENLECLIMQIQIYLCIDRSDLANNIFNKMKEIDDDDVLTNIACIIIGIYNCNEESIKLSLEALDNLMSIRDTSLLRNNLSVCYLQLHNYTNSWKNIGKAKDICKKCNISVNSTTLINGMIALKHLNKGMDNIPKMENELIKISKNNHLYLNNLKEMSDLFDKSAQNFKI